MWADTLQGFEKQHLLILTGWGGASVLTGGLLLAVLSLRRIKAPLLSQLALQFTLWGVAELVWALFAHDDVPLRDYEGAAGLARELWLAIGLEAGGILLGLTLIIGGWSYVRRPGVIGAGIGIVVQACALIVLDLILVRGISL